MVAGVSDSLLLRSHSGNLDAVARNAERFQEVRMKIRVADAASAGPLCPDETILVATDQKHVLVNLSLEIGEGGRFIGERDVLADGRDAQQNREGTEAAQQGANRGLRAAVH